MTPEGGVLWGRCFTRACFWVETCLRGKLGPGWLLSLQAPVGFSSPWLERALPWGAGETQGRLGPQLLIFGVWHLRCSRCHGSLGLVPGGPAALGPGIEAASGEMEPRPAQQSPEEALIHEVWTWVDLATGFPIDIQGEGDGAMSS